MWFFFIFIFYNFLGDLFFYFHWSLLSAILFDVFSSIVMEEQEVVGAARDDVRAVEEIDPACLSYIYCFLKIVVTR